VGFRRWYFPSMIVVLQCPQLSPAFLAIALNFLRKCPQGCDPRLRIS
jgi:hypothetical protein